ncbi:MAG: SUMF1/EgtB/PvdO family nonheme iron enzyme [Muribaculaceae bacterium]|nr:SUMF1/EgtB/PvdO family nonheme iron enzyme [Muribaculaceae bacterium]
MKRNTFWSRLLCLAVLLCGASLTVRGGVNGDVNGDGAVDVDDLNEVINEILELPHSASGDVNGNGAVDIDDLNVVVNLILGLTPGTTVETRTYTVNGVSFTMVAVEGGTFTMGATAEQGSDARDNEYPAHQVTLSSYCIGATEVTQALWHAVMGENPSNFKGEERPVECVSRDECEEFIARLNALTGLAFRLPTEAEWEFAARGGNKSQGFKYAGGNNIGEVAWYCYNTPGRTGCTQPVATKAPNELGLYDMSGNVSEWCQDNYGSYDSEPQVDPAGPDWGYYCVVRGGCWFFYAENCRVSYRMNGSTGVAADTLGLRLAL